MIEQFCIVEERKRWDNLSMALRMWWAHASFHGCFVSIWYQKIFLIDVEAWWNAFLCFMYFSQAWWRFRIEHQSQILCPIPCAFPQTWSWSLQSIRCYYTWGWSGRGSDNDRNQPVFIDLQCGIDRSNYFDMVSKPTTSDCGASGDGVWSISEPVSRDYSALRRNNRSEPHSGVRCVGFIFQFCSGFASRGRRTWSYEERPATSPSGVGQELLGWEKSYI